jgi:hypothetical protein
LRLGGPLFRRLLGSGWDLLPPAIQRLHSVTTLSTFTGECTVERGRNPFAQLIAHLVGFPRAGANQKITVSIAVEADGERWTRNVAGREFSSTQRPSARRPLRTSVGEFDGDAIAAKADYRAGRSLLREGIGVLSFDIELTAADGILKYVVCHSYFLGIPLPLWLGPKSTAWESAEGGCFRFDVEIRHIFIGLIVRYRGWLLEDMR